jgi:hypothetical protein
MPYTVVWSSVGLKRNRHGGRRYGTIDTEIAAIGKVAYHAIVAITVSFAIDTRFMPLRAGQLS